jgi:tetratricopeptide (TPR) repeat protein
LTEQQQRSAGFAAFDSFSAFDLAAAAVLALACWIVYWGALDVGFVLDDWPDIVDNRVDQWPAVSLDAAARSVAASDDRRPVAHLSFGLNHAVAGLDPRGYHVVNVLIHLCNGWLVYAFACALFRRERALEGQLGRRLAPAALRPAALVAALLFVVHPIQIQSVTYIVQRMTSLATGFYLAALLCFLQGRTATAPSRRWLWWSGACLCGLLSLGSKEIAFTLPLAIGLVEWFFIDDLNRDWLRRRAPLLGIFALASAGVIALSLTSVGWERFEFSPVERLLTQTRVAVLYLSLIVAPLPSRLNLLHQIETSTSLFSPIATLFCAGLLVALFAVAIREARRRRLFSFAVLWLFLGLAIESSVVPLRMIFEHRVYLPLVGPALLASHALFTFTGPRARIVIASLSIAALCLGTVLRNQLWQDPLQLWTDTATKSPGEPLAQARLGALLAAAGRLDTARVRLERAIELDPDLASAHNALGLVWRGFGDTEKALAFHRRAVALAPGDASARIHAVDALAALGRLDEATALLAEVEASAADERLLHRLAQLREQQGREDEALALHRRIAALAPDFAPARIDAGRILVRRGEAQLAVESFRAALVPALPGSPRALEAAAVHTWIANVWWRAGRADLAVAELDEALGLAPEWPMASLHLAWMLATGPAVDGADPERAVSLAATVLGAQGPGQAEVLDVLAAAHAAAGRPVEAEALARKAARVAREAGAVELAEDIEARRIRYAEGERITESMPPPGRLAPW